MNAWLIERGQSEGQVPTIWWRSSEWKSREPYLGQWTEDANEARKFSTKEDAERQARIDPGQFYRVTEHVWLTK